jgi:RNA polymerase sigma factor (sigma-70 family)
MAMTASLADRVAQLFSASQAGLSAEAFSALYDRAHLTVFRYVYGLCGGPPQEVEDLTAETFLRAWQARERFTGAEDAAVGWLLRIARNLVIDNHRRGRARFEDEDHAPEMLVAPDAAPEEQAQQREQWRTLWQLLHTLPPISADAGAALPARLARARHRPLPPRAGKYRLRHVTPRVITPAPQVAAAVGRNVDVRVRRPPPAT